MSAYLCNPEDFALLAAYALEPGAIVRRFINFSKKEYIDAKDATDLAVIFAEENINSLEYRYPNSGPAGGFLCGTLEEFLAEVKNVAKARYDYNDLTNVKNVLERYEYQACEHADWLESDAYNLVRAIKDLLLDEFAYRYELAQAELAYRYELAQEAE
jgi:hypothetical protein